MGRFIYPDYWNASKKWDLFTYQYWFIMSYTKNYIEDLRKDKILSDQYTLQNLNRSGTNMRKPLSN